MNPDDPRRRNLRRGGEGRKKGTPNKATVEVRELARRIVEDEQYQAVLKKRLLVGKAPHLETLLWHYAYGKPKETLDLTGDLDVRVRDAQASLDRKLAALAARVGAPTVSEQADE